MSLYGSKGAVLHSIIRPFSESLAEEIKSKKKFIKMNLHRDEYENLTLALDYGCQHENIAKDDLLKELGKTHHNIQSDPIGFFINPRFPYFGASPDGIVTCDCCGTSTIEVKCPYCARFTGVTDLIEKDTYMIQRDGRLSLKEGHEYYYQVQMQLALTGLKTCHFIVWSKKDFAHCLVPFDEEFWNRESSKAKDFFSKVILPEALGKYFTKSQPGPSKTVPALYCLCQQEDGKRNPMIAWESGHCVGLSEIPGENWICDFCKIGET
ncbi:hypothetical protein JTB14_012502 [Gonioctena quinquepunctata]|nr:hypothetical protein JTB14_012502 [Gonioctena quinquepunctata]